MSDSTDEDMEEFEKLEKGDQKKVIDRVLEKYESKLEEVEDQEVRDKIKLKKSILKKMKENLG